jgi:epsilon-lactone hydrolase
MKRAVSGAYSPEALESVRAPRSRIERMLTSLNGDVKVTTFQVGGGEAEAFEIAGIEPERTVLHIPGGGFIMHAMQAHRQLAARLARLARARVVLVHYRLAPENPFPAGLDDCVAAYRHLVESGTDPANLSLLGDSAGGCLALSTLLRLRMEGLPQPSSAVLISPVTDLSYSGASRNYNRWFDPSLTNDDDNIMAELYLRDTPVEHPLVSPLFGDLSGLAPLLIQVGSVETLLDDSLRVAAKVRSQGGECECEVWHEMPHDWVLFGMLPEAKKALSHVAAFISRHAKAPRSTASVMPDAHRATESRLRVVREVAPAGLRAA